MAFGFGFALTAIAKAVGFSPLSLFTSGAQGAWYDPSDYSTMFEDSAGTIPITTPLEKPVGLMLDKSRGLVLGSELVTNGDFSNGTTGWTLKASNNGTSDGTFTVSNGQATIVRNSTDAFVYQPGLTLSSGKFYLITFQLISGQVHIGTGDITNPTSVVVTLAGQLSGAGTKTALYYASSNRTVVVWPSNPSSTATFDNISVRELPGNHATQSTTTSRPTLSARYNLLTKTEQFDVTASWPHVSVGVGGSLTRTGNYANSPIGTQTATRLQITKGTYSYVTQTVSIATGTSCRFTAYIKLTSGSTPVTVNIGDGNVGYSTITVNDTWQLFTYTGTTATTNFLAAIGLQSSTSDSVDILVWGADLRVANDGVGLPAYQRVNTATDYDYAGFPPYLKFDGTDDGMATGSIDFTGTDKMSVFAGVRVGAGGTQMMVELSSNTNTNAGAFYSYATATNVYWYSRGSASPIKEPTALISVPTTMVVTGLGDIAGDSSIIRKNGVQSDQSTSDQGTGNYGNYPLYIGRRGGTSYPFNGRIYSLVVVGKLASAAEIASTETWVNGKTKAF